MPAFPSRWNMGAEGESGWQCVCGSQGACAGGPERPRWLERPAGQVVVGVRLSGLALMEILNHSVRDGG